MRLRDAVALLCCLAAWPSAVATAADPPVRITHLTTREGKPPLRSHSVRLTLENPHDRPAWFLLPYWGDEPLSPTGVFVNKGDAGKPFGGKRYEGEGGAAIEVEMYGGAGFKAFRLPAGGRVELDGYAIEAWKDFAEVVVLEAEALKVNGKTPLEKWLPYGTTCDKKVKVAPSVDWKNLDWDPEQSKAREDYPKEKVQEVRAEGVRRWALKFGREGK